MGQGRRDFLRAIVMAPAGATAAAAVVKDRGGELNLSDRPVPVNTSWRAQGMVDVRDHGLYDSIRIPAGKEVPHWLPLFSAPVGCNTPGTWDFKTFLHTNMATAGMLPPPTEQKVERIVFLVNPGADQQDLDELCSSYYWEFMLCNKVMARAPVARKPVFGDIGDLFFIKDGPLSRSIAGRRTPLRLPQEVAIHLKQPVMIGSLMHFGFNLYGAPFTTRAPLEFYVVLDGMGVFGIQ